MCESTATRVLKGDPRITAELSRLRQTDNLTNWLYILRAWGIIALAISGAVSFYYMRADWGLAWAWNVPVTILAYLVIGASQHQLAGAGHEATHYILFRNRYLNELASDWVCMFPLFTSTHTFRLYHQAHHQFVNDPQRDPDFAMLAASGHWLKFPVRKAEFLIKIAKQFLVFELIRYTLTRFLFNSVGAGREAPYTIRSGTLWPKVVGGVYFLATWAGVRFLREFESAAPMWTAELATLGIAVGIIAFLPDRHFEKTKIRPVYPIRAITISRMVFITALFLALTMYHRATGIPAGPLFILLWIGPLLTTFGLCMILRQLVQHGNADSGWVTNSRVFLMNPLLRYAVFPFGMDYHTPHHMYATVPHYQLPRLHQFLLQFEDYRKECVEVHNYVIHETEQEPRPTVLDVLSTEQAGRDSSHDGMRGVNKAEQSPPTPLTLSHPVNEDSVQV